MPAITLLLPALAGGAALERSLASLIRQSAGDFLCLLATNGHRELAAALPLDDPRFRAVHDEFRNLASMKYGCFRRWPGELLAELPEGLELEPEALERLILHFRQRPACGAAYGSYHERPVGRPDADAKTLHPRLHPGDLTERVNLGPLVVWRAVAVAEAGGWDPAFNTAQEYDLRLRLPERWTFESLDAPLATIRPGAAETAAARSLGASKVFSPGEGPQGGFSYLFYGPAEEMEFETAFKNRLRREGAYLSRPPETAPAGEGEIAVSVVIPFHDRGRFIGKAIQSVVDGAFQDFEILCVDNCSTDDGADVVRAWTEKDSRVKLLSSDRNVIARALNIGVSAARGRLVAQLDSDDEYTPRTLAAAVEAFEANPTWALAISYYELMEEDGTPIPDLGVIKHLEYDPNNHLRVDGAGAVRVWKRAAIVQLGGFDEEHYGDFAEDYDLVAKVAERWEVGRLHEVLYRYRRHADNTDVKRSAEMKIGNKTRIRHEAIARRRALNGCQRS